MSIDRSRDAYYVSIRPAPRQIAYQKLEFYGFIHYTVNAFTDREWGQGTEPESVFAPTALDCDQWARVAAEGGMKGLILTCKHHDGFCLWPSAYTEHSVKNSPCKRDIVGELSEACKRHGLKFGVYLSPWDRNSALYGTGDEYNDYFVNQLTELMTNYGPIFSVWFDGACGEGPNGKKQVYDWPRYYEVIRRLQPDACICVCGPDVRWCGNEAGDTRESEWSVVPERLRRAETVEGKSQKADDESFRQKRITSMDRDLGSREALKGEDDLVWYPAEVNTSIRPGWFYHQSEDDRVKSFETLKNVYINAVGGNAMFLLNLPPDRRGLIHENDEAVMKKLGAFIRDAFKDNLAAAARLNAPDAVTPVTSADLLDYENGQTFATAEGRVETALTLSWPEEQSIGFVTLQEDIAQSQRIEAFDLIADGRTVYSGTTVGYRRIVAFDEPIRAKRLEIAIRDARVSVTLKALGVYGPYPCQDR